MKTFFAWMCCSSLVLTACSTIKSSTPTPDNPPQQSPPTPLPTVVVSPKPAAITDPLATPDIKLLIEPVATSTDDSPIDLQETPQLLIDPSGQKITFWHVWGAGATGETMAEIVKEFNEKNEWGIEIATAVHADYGELEYAVNSAVPKGETPNIITAYSNVLARLWQDGLLADLNPYFEHPQFGFTKNEESDFYQAALEAGLVGADRIGFPISQSGNVIFYNRTWAQELGFQTPPASSQEFKTQACAASRANNSDGTGGFVLYPGTANLLSWIYAFDGDIFDKEGKYYSFDTPVSRDVAVFLKDLEDKGCSFETKSYPNPEFATRRAIFTTSSSVGCQYQQRAFEKEAKYNDQWELIPFPGPSGNKAITIFPQMIGIVNHTPEQNLAAWLFIKHLNSPDIQAKWAVGSQYYPVRVSAVSLLSEFITGHPQWASGLELLSFAQAEPTRPSWGLVRHYMQETFSDILQVEPDKIDQMLASLDLVSIEAIAETE